MTRLIIDKHIPFIKGVLEPYAKIDYVAGDRIDNKMVRKADGLIIRTRTLCDKSLLHDSSVNFIATATIGFDHIDTEYCSQNGIHWQHAPGCNANSVMQYLASVLSSLATNRNFSLSGKRIGIIGVGHVGSKIAALAKGIGMIPMLNDPPRAANEGPHGFVSLEEIQENADIITLHVPLNIGGIYHTHHLADDNFFESLSKAPLLVNTSRGPVVETPAVKNAIRNGKISGFAADVWESEPDIDPELLNLALVATPHIAGYSVEGKANGTAAAVQAASRFFGFGLDNWYPASLAESVEQNLAHAILSTYNVRYDDIMLRNDPSRFEHYRNHYPVRREPPAFKINIKNSTPELEEKLKSLGFQIKRN
jgi:erythronate-4-phosphate dehydrogenase